MGSKPLGHWSLFSGFANQSTMACICCMGGKEKNRIGCCKVFRGIKGGKVIGIEAVLSS